MTPFPIPMLQLCIDFARLETHQCSSPDSYAVKCTSCQIVAFLADRELFPYEFGLPLVPLSDVCNLALAHPSSEDCPSFTGTGKHMPVMHNKVV